MIDRPIHLKVGAGQSPAAAASGIARYCEHSAEPRSAGGLGPAGYYPWGKAPSRWLGRGAELLGLEGEVKHEDFVAVLQGKLPNGVDLSGRGNRQHDRRMGTDITFSFPKSFSMLSTSGIDPRLDALSEEVMREVARVIESEVVIARLGKGGHTVEHTGKMLCAAFRHEDARPVNGVVGPDDHWHLIILNATQRADGEWCARDLDFGERNTLRVLADFAGKAYLAKRLQELGYRIRRTDDGLEIEGISREAIEKASPRSGQIEAELERRGKTRESSTSAERDDINLATRESKTTISREEQRWDWRRDAREQWGVDLQSIMREAQERSADGITLEPKDLSSEAVKSGTRHLAERDTVFGRDELRLEALKAGMGNVTFDTVAAQVALGEAGLLDAGQSTAGRAQYTTKDALHREQHVLQRARAGQGTVPALMSEAEARQYIEEFEQAEHARNPKFIRLADGQRAALMLTLTTTDQITGIVGAPGAGKTTSMKGLVAASRAGGNEIIGIAPTNKAVRQLKSAECDDIRTIASFLAAEVEHDPHRLVIIDEAGMVGAGDMDAIMEKLKRVGGRILPVGDPQQIQSVQAGTPFAQMLKENAIKHARVDEIYRQTNLELREVVQRFADGDAKGGTELAIKRYGVTAEITAEKPGKPTKEERIAGIAKTAAGKFLARDAETRAHTFVLSVTHAVRRQTNAHIRAALQESGDVSRDEVPIHALDKFDLSAEKLSRPEHYAPGTVVRLNEKVRGPDRKFQYVQNDCSVARVSGERVILRDNAGHERSWSPARQPAAGVYAPRDMTLAKGDLIIFRDNIGRGDDKIVNTQTAVIEQADRGGIVARLDDGRVVEIDPNKNHVIDHGWCRTVHSSQGAEDEEVIGAILAGSAGAAELANVTISRAKEKVDLVSDDLGRLQKTWEKWTEHQYARDLAKQPDPTPETLPELRRQAAAELGKTGDLARARDPEPQPDLEPELEAKRDRGRGR